MNNLIDLLSIVGEKPVFSKENKIETLENAMLDTKIKQAILEKDDTTLNELLGVKHRIVCAVLPADVPDNDDEPDNDKITRTTKIA